MGGLEDQLLNARKRHGRIHFATVPQRCCSVLCSTLESVMVGFTGRQSIGWRWQITCSTLESVMVGFTEALYGAGRQEANCSTLESVMVGFTLPPLALALGGHSLLHARKRHGRSHGVDGLDLAAIEICSTLESVMVGFTTLPDACSTGRGSAQRSKASWSDSRGAVDLRRRFARLLNARKRHGRIHALWRAVNLYANTCSTLESVMVGFTPITLPTAVRTAAAQRSKASWSDSPGSTIGKESFDDFCSTLESVMVGFTSPSVVLGLVSRRLLNARKRHGRIHTLSGYNYNSSTNCSTLESVMVGFTRFRSAATPISFDCSTLESVMVGFTRSVGPQRP